MCVVAKKSPTAPLLRRSTIATVRMALAELPASLADLRRALRKGAVFDSRDAVYDAVRLLGHREEHRVRVSGGKPNYIRFLCSTVPVRGIKEYRRSQPDGGCPFTLSCVQRGCTWVVIASRLNRTCARRSQSVPPRVLASMGLANIAATDGKRGEAAQVSWAFTGAARASSFAALGSAAIMLTSRHFGRAQVVQSTALLHGVRLNYFQAYRVIQQAKLAKRGHMDDTSLVRPFLDALQSNDPQTMCVTWVWFCVVVCGCGCGCGCLWPWGGCL